ncbi:MULTISPECIES: DUF1830 domain-containing protein [unclassified Microcoleus]|uniref:DUF1830 domain-containing protein n=1 Tax=unclassified Microcoleus TaxID=2642155 RepID=UPI0025E15AEB|nr:MULTISPECIES: DUF1830 domain-containing protein [unclassified Microcoleus]
MNSLILISPSKGEAFNQFFLVSFLKSVEISQMSYQLSSQGNNQILCYYANTTNQIQVLRIGNIPNWYFERVMFPGQQMMFEAAATAVLEIHTGAVASAILSDNIPCYVLRVIEEVSSEFDRVIPEAKYAVLAR